MKLPILRRHPALWAVVCLIPVAAPAADDLVVNTFDDPSEAVGWIRWWGIAGSTIEHDATQDAAGSAASGALKVTIPFDLAAYTGENQIALRRDLPAVVNGLDYLRLEFDVKFDPTSPTQGSNFGYLEYGSRQTDYGQDYFGNIQVPSGTTGWVHVTRDIPITNPEIDQFAGVTLKIWSGGNDGMTGTTVMWVDNVKMIAKQGPPPPPPTMGIETARPGLTITASKAGAPYQRQNVRTKQPTYSWTAEAAPVTYSLTIEEYPDAAHSNFQTHLFLVPGASLPTWETAPDWNEPNVIFLSIANNADGTATAACRFKTNQANGNSMYYAAEGTLGYVNSATATGTWTYSLQGSSLTVTPSSGAPATLAIPDGVAALFADPLYAYFGVQPNTVENIGQSVRFSRIAIDGLATPLEDLFEGGPDVNTETWDVVADDAPGLVVVPADAPFWLVWSVPDAGFVLQNSSTLKAAEWSDITNATPRQVGSQKRLLLTPELMPEALGFFRLQKP